MLTTFRKGAQGIFAKLLLGLLVLSFALWGVGDIFRLAGDDSVATVDGDPISEAELQHTIRQLQLQFEELTPEVAQSLQVQLQTLNRLINTKLLEKEANDLGLDFSDEVLTKRIADDPMFQDADGKFNRDRFLSLLAEHGIGQGMFMQRYERDLQLNLAESIVSQSMRAPRNMVELYYHIRHEEREASLILIDKKDIDPIGSPANEELEALYDANMENFRKPEYRTYRYTYFDAEKIAKMLGLSPTADDVQAYYDVHQVDYARPETREVLQLMFDNQADADAAYSALLAQAGDTKTIDAATLRDYASGDAAITNRDVLISSLIAQGDLPEVIADEVFQLGSEQISTPLETGFGWQIYYIESVQDAGTAAFDDVKDDINTLLLAQNVEEQLTQLSNQLDDSIGAGATFDEALQQVELNSLTIETLGPISITNELRNGEIYEMKPFEQEILSMAFEQDAGEISPISLSNDSRYFLVETLDVIPTEIPAIEDVTETLTLRWRQDKTDQALLDKAVEIEQSLGESENPIAAAKERGLSLHTTGRLKRHHDTVSNQSQLKDKILTSDFVQALFSLRPNEVSMPFPLPSGEYAIGIMDAIHDAPEADDVALELIQRELDAQLKQQALSAYLSALREKYSVEIFLDKLAQGAAS